MSFNLTFHYPSPQSIFCLKIVIAQLKHILHLQSEKCSEFTCTSPNVYFHLIVKSEAISIFRLGNTNSEILELKLKCIDPPFSSTDVRFSLTPRIVTCVRGGH